MLRTWLFCDGGCVVQARRFLVQIERMRIIGERAETSMETL